MTVLASDMDGTFIPLDGNDQNRRDLERLKIEVAQHDLELIYVTGRHFEIVIDAIRTHGLPTPQWLICDVGASIYRQAPDGVHQIVPEYHHHLAEVINPFDVQWLSDSLSDVDAIRPQEPEKQGRFKLSYYCDAESVETLGTMLTQRLTQLQAPFSIISSVDPFTGVGLIDFLPTGTSKAFALDWWVRRNQNDLDEIVFAGDSGNDLAALTAGYRSIIVGNAETTITKEATRAHESAGWTDRLFLAKAHATSGVLEGLLHFLRSGGEEHAE